MIEKSHNGIFIDKVDKCGIMKCNVCGFKHLDPIPSTKELDDFYKAQYYGSHKSEYISQDNRDIYFLNISFQDRLRVFTKSGQGKRILDIGCGAGMFMKYAQERGWDCTGIEPSEVAWEQALKKNLRVYHQTIGDFASQSTEKYDIIHLKNVLEHVPDPSKILEIAHSLLNGNGILYIEVPNDYDLSQRFGVWLLSEKKSWLAIPDHINYFNFKSLKKLLQKYNFKIFKKTTTFPIYFLLSLGINFIKYKNMGARAHNIRMNFEIKLHKYNMDFIRRIIYNFLSFLNLGRTVIFYCKKTKYNLNKHRV
jgi:2-polyprenyl-3-methyl-5-hydroxy-6-metoxy-1,4-benzoquinol methylase